MPNHNNYGSFRCPTILIDGVENLKKRWPTKIKNAQFYFLAATYACQHKNITHKKISGSYSETEIQMIRLTPELTRCIDDYLSSYPGMTKTDFYILSLVEFLKVCDSILLDVDNAFLAEGDHNDRGLILRQTLKRLFPYKKNLLGILCEETFDAGDKIYCITTRKVLSSLLLDDLFKYGDLDPRKIYTMI